MAWLPAGIQVVTVQRGQVTLQISTGTSTMIPTTIYVPTHHREQHLADRELDLEEKLNFQK